MLPKFQFKISCFFIPTMDREMGDAFRRDLDRHDLKHYGFEGCHFLRQAAAIAAESPVCKFGIHRHELGGNDCLMEPCHRLTNGAQRELVVDGIRIGGFMGQPVGVDAQTVHLFTDICWNGSSVEYILDPTEEVAETSGIRSR